MPIYEYECTECGRHTEAMQNFSDPPLSECELCHGEMKKLISQSSFHLKGTGWYVTDYASKNGRNQGKPSNAGDRSGSGESKTSEKTSQKSDSTSGEASDASKKKDSSSK